MTEITLQITDSEFGMLQEIVHKAIGMRLTSHKKRLVISRLRKRLTELKIKKFYDYIKLIKDPKSIELKVFIDAITTNETFFYRHPQQFDALAKSVLPDLVNRKKSRNDRTIRLWSAGCATGEEPYSLAIACDHFFRSRPGWSFVIYATDVNREVISASRKAEYGERSIAPLPQILKSIYFTSVKKEGSRLEHYQLQERVKSFVRFYQHNLLKSFSFKDFDIIFLRNVMIYFDQKSKQEVINLIEPKLARGGYLFISLTETLAGIKCGLNYLGGGIYQKES